jgi:Fe-Mn family superoxide dismutase
MAFALPDLPYDKSALAPHVSAETLTFHHDKHHNTYVTKMNEAIAGTPLEGKSLEEVVKAAVEQKNQGLYNNAAQTWNHTFYWNSMSPNPGQPSAALKGAIDTAFGGMESFVEKFKAKGAGHFASGWVWLFAKRDGTVDIRDSHDAGVFLPSEEGVPLLLVDVWEHAYYIDKRNDRMAYLTAVTGNLLNWTLANSQYEAAKAGSMGWAHPR